MQSMFGAAGILETLYRASEGLQQTKTTRRK